MTAEARGPFPVVPLAPTLDEWVEQLAASIREVDPDPAAADAVLRDVLHVPLPRLPEPESCWRCHGSREIPFGNDPLGRDLYDPCPECDPEL